MKKHSKKIKRVLGIVLTLLLLLRMIPSVCADEVGTGTKAEFTEENESAPAESSSANRGSISGILWYDENSDGIRNDGEKGVAHYPVSLFKAGNTDNAVQTVTTDSDGNYTFTGIEQGAYVAGIKSETVNGSEYLLPLEDIVCDYGFTIGNIEGGFAYTETIVVQANSKITGIDAGMRTEIRMQSKVPATYDLNIEELSGTAVGNGVTITDNVATFSNVNPSDTYVITGITDTNTIIINPDETVNLILSGVDIKTQISPIQLLGTAVVVMTLSEANTLECTNIEEEETGHCKAGLYVGPDATLTIGGTVHDTLSVTGGYYSAGIGGSIYDKISNCGTINITGGTVTARSQAHGAGIGGGTEGSGGVITINGGTVSADGSGGAGIGGGSDGDGGVITINGGVVMTNGSSGGAGIGGGDDGDGGKITINGGLVKANGKSGGAGIGGGYHGNGGMIIISGGIVVGTGEGWGAGIGGGFYGNGGETSISGGTVTATGSLEMSMDIGHGFSGGDGTTVITGGSVWPTSGASSIDNPTNGTTNGNDKVGMVTFTALASQNFSFVTAGSGDEYTYSGTGHEAAGYIWMPLSGVTTNEVTEKSTTPAKVTAPDTVNSPASSMATLNGVFYLNNNKPVTNAYFEWGTSENYGDEITVAGSPEPAETAIFSRSETITDLQPDTTYYYRFVIVTDGITIPGNYETFTTPALAPSVAATHSVTGSKTATLYGIYSLNASTLKNGEFQISTTGTEGSWITLTNSSIPTISSAAGVTEATGQLDNSTTTPSVNLTNLTLNTDYYYRFVVTNNEGTSEAKGSWRQEGFTIFKIDKTVTGSYGDPNKEFEITITLEDDGTPVAGLYEYTGSAISGVNAPNNGSISFNKSGQGTIKLKHGQAIAIDGITLGCTYTVQETDPAVTGGIYTASYDGTGNPSITQDSISGTLGRTTTTVSIINDRSTVPSSGLSERIDYRLGAVGFLAILIMLWSCRRRRTWK